MEKYDKLMVATGLVVLLIAIPSAFVFAGTEIVTAPAEEGIDFTKLEFKSGHNHTESTEPLNENSETTLIITLNYEYLKNVTFKLSANDEPAGAGRDNEPDNFKLYVTSPTNESKSNAGQTGTTIIVCFEIAPEARSEWKGDWIITIALGDCGDIYREEVIPGSPIPKMIKEEDTSNSWTLIWDYVYYVEPTT
jgi:hypothetical protein